MADTVRGAEVSQRSAAERLTSLDGLRAVAAIVVMLYHYTQRYRERFDADWHPAFSYDGQFGVLLFFMISGYVITLTTTRLRRPRDFLFFRFSRLYPTFWACLAITAILMLLAKAPLTIPPPSQLLLNATMLAKTIRRFMHWPDSQPYVDGAYWSLEIELFFYAAIFLLLITRQMNRIVGIAIAMVTIGAVDHWLLMAGRPAAPSPVRWVLFFDYWPYFGIGIALFAMKNHRQYRWPSVLIGLSLLRASEHVAANVLGIVEPGKVTQDPTTPLNVWVELVKVLGCTALFSAAVFDRLPPLRWKIIVAIGAVSYPLYLLHQNLGYIVIAKLHGPLSLPTHVTIGAAIAVAFALATAVSIGIERPTMHLLRRLYLRWTHHVAPPAVVSGLAPSVPRTAEDRQPL
ncbi:MAG: oatA [Phycisphaerales bacterium]|nr:oatA [Phycisphaerales bacterium]